MKNLLIETWSAVGGIVAGVSDLFATLFTWLFSVLLILHNDMPRLEGLLVGVLLAWFFVHREKNPIIRALAAPLKIVLDILDIIWDETIETLRDIWDSGIGYVKQGFGWVKEKAKGLLGGLTGALMSLKNKIVRKKDDDPTGE